MRKYKIYNTLFISILLIMISSVSCFAIEFKDENNNVFDLDENNKTATIMKFENLDIENVVIPEKINDFTVTKIGERAFGEPRYKKLKSVILPDSITEIKKSAFRLCSNLEYVKLPKNLKYIGENCFSLCSSLKEIEIPDSVDFIGEEAFYNCTSLEKINIPKSLKILQKRLFQHCISLDGIYIHENIEQICDDIFYECGVNLTLNNTQVHENNKFYKKQDNFIINKETGNKIIEFALCDDEYYKKDMLAKKLYDKMVTFLDKYKNYSIENLDNAFKEFLKYNTKPQKILTKEQFQKGCKENIILYRGIMKREFIDDFKSGKTFFSDNLKNERGTGIYTTSQFNHAEIWIWSQKPDDYKILEQYEHDEKLYEEMMYKLVPHGEVITMFLDMNLKI